MTTRAWRGCTTAWATVLTLGLLLPGGESTTGLGQALGLAAILGHDSGDKVVHGVLFGVLCALVWKSLPSLRGAGRLAGAVVATTVYGAVTEVLQAFVPDRTPELGDLVADGLGALLAGLLVWAVSRRRTT